jgi:drug/metabolite transporter (DMT)-like permease
VLIGHAERSTPASRTGPLIHLMPAFGALLVMGLLGERLSGFHGVGIGRILAGIGLATARRRS